MNLPIILAYPLSIAASLILALVVFLANSKNIVNRFFALFTLSIVAWTTTLFISTFVTSFRLVNLLTKLNFAFILLLAYTLFYFSYYFPKKTFNLRPLLHFVFAFETIGLILLTLLTFEITEVGRAFGGEKLIVYGRLYPFFVVHFLIFSAFSLFILFSKLRKSKGFPKAQIECLILGLSTALLFGLMMRLLLPRVFKIYNFDLLRPLTALFFLGFTSYGIIKLRLVSIRFIAARTTAYFLLIFLVVLLVTSALYSFSVFVVGQFIDRTQIFFFTLFVLFILFAYPTLSSFLEKATGRVFLKDHYNSRSLLKTLGLITTSTLSLEDLIKDVLNELLGKMKTLRASVVLVKNFKIFGVKAATGRDVSLFNEEEILEVFKIIADEKRILVLDELEEGKIKGMLKKLNLMVAAPLRAKGEKVGFLFLGEKWSDEIYSVQDISVLEILVPGLTIAIQNALAYEEIKKFNFTLKEEVEKATDQLRKANEKLKELDKLKDEFLSITTHALRTPMTAIRGYIDMILSGDAGKINKKVREFLFEAFGEASRLTGLVNDILNVSRIDEKKLILEIKNIDLAQEIKNVLQRLAPLAKEKGLTFSYQPLKDLPLVKADSAKLRQVLNNLIGNAIQFTEKGSITVSHKLKNNFVVTEIKDSGVGIAKADMGKLFQKFSKVDGSLKKERGGAGLGLYISKGLIESMGGKIWAESRLGKDSAFSFSLPIVK